MPAGTKLPAEREFARLLGVSRASVRDALHELALKGFLDRRPGRGTVVAGEHRDRVGQFLGVVDPSQRTLEEIVDFRLAVEPPIAARAAERALPLDIRQLDELLRHDGAQAEHASVDHQFHLLIARATYNPLLVRLMEMTADWVVSLRAASLQTTRRVEVSRGGHRSVFEAIRNHDDMGATRAMTEHIKHVAQQTTKKS